MDLANIPRKLDTRDLHLRPSNMADAEAMYVILSDPQSMKYWSHAPATDISVAVKTLTEDLESDAKGNTLCWTVTLKGKDEMIGKCILFNFSPANRRAEIGFILNRNYWRQGPRQEQRVQH